MAKVKIIVVKNLNRDDIFGKNPPAEAIEEEGPQCEHFKIGDEFYIDDPTQLPPPRFCAWAWADIESKVMHLLYGGNFPWMKEKGVYITCCTDGLNPVIFKLERIED